MSNVLINEFNYRFLFTARVADTINDSNKLYNKYEIKKIDKAKNNTIVRYISSQLVRF